MGVAVLLGGLWAVTRGQAAAADTGGVGREAGAKAPEGETAQEQAPTLVGIQDPAETLREAISEASVDGVAVPEAGETLEVASVSGTLHLPSGMEPTESIQLIAWSKDDGDRAPVGIEIEASARDWTFLELPVGSWVIAARAVAGDHCAWGKSKELRTRAGEAYDGVAVALKEFGVEGLVRSAGGAPLPGIRVAYDLDYSDPAVGDIEAWTRRARRKPVLASLSGRSFGIAFDSEGVAVDVSVSSGGQVKYEPSDRRVMTYNSEPSELLKSLVAELEVRAAEELPEPSDASAPGGAPSAGVSSRGAFVRSSMGINSVWGVKGDEQPSIPTSGSVITDEAGRFWIALPGPGEVTVRATASPSDLAANDPGYLGDSTSVDLTDSVPVAAATLTLELAAALTGRVVRTDGELGEINVFLTSLEGKGSDVASVDASGEFRFPKQRPGSYVFYARGGGKNGQAYCTDAELQLVAGSVYRLDDVLRPSSSLTGVLLGPDGEPLANTEVVALGANNRSLKRSGRTDQWGMFTISGMYAVDYTLEVSGKKVAEGATFRVPPGGATASAGTQTISTAPVPNR